MPRPIFITSSRPPHILATTGPRRGKPANLRQLDVSYQREEADVMVNLRRTMAILGATALTLAIAVTAVVAGGPLRALAAPASTGATVGSPSSAGVSTEAS